MLKNHDYLEEFPVKGKRIVLAYPAWIGKRNFTIRRLPFLSLISVGNKLSREQVRAVTGALCEYASEFSAMDRYFTSHLQTVN